MQLKTVEKINELRALHNAAPLTFDPSSDLTVRAQVCADNTIETKCLKHTTMSDMGQNIFAMSAGFNLDATQGVVMWYNEVDIYDPKAPGWQDGCGHFTQLVWKASQQVGIGLATSDELICLVANFYPKGNVYGEYEENVEKDNSIHKSIPMDCDNDDDNE